MRHEVLQQHVAANRGRGIGLACTIGLTLASLLASGCSTLAIPAFDPSGNRIFATTPTQVTLPQLHGPTGTSVLPNAGFPEPRTPPPCVQGPPAPPASVPPVVTGSAEERGRCGQMLLTPTQIVAPVGGEVLLLAGICGEDGYFVTGEPIEWMLSPESVGEIIEVGDDMKGKRRSFFASKSEKPAVEKLDVDFARGRTSSEAGRITRGSHRNSDDLIVRKGQTWVSLTSPTEGMSRVTVLAPDSDVWDRRRQTATIYWIDASWQFPQNESRRVGEKVTLVTNVKKAEGFAPAEGWLVKYRILSEGFGQFLTNNPNALYGTDARVDADGKAYVEIVNPANRPGTAIVGIEIARPADADAKMRELPIARDQVLVTWSAPLLKLIVNGNTTTSVNQPIDYRIVVGNSGDMAAENVKLILNLKNPSLQATYLNIPPSTQSNIGATWELQTLPAGRAHDIMVRVTPTVESENTIEFIASATGLAAEKADLPLSVIKPQVDLKFSPVRGNEQAEVGQSVVLEVVATNTGRQTINNLLLRLDSDPGLQHERGGNQITVPIPIIPPGQSQSVNLRYIVRRGGELNTKLTALIDGLTVGERTAFVRGIDVVPKQPNLQVRLEVPSGRTSLTPNAEVEVHAMVQNLGQTLLSNIQVNVDYAPSLALTQAADGVQQNPASGTARWFYAGGLEPQKQITYRMFFRLNAGTPPPKIQLSAATSEGLRGQSELVFNVAAGDVLPTTNDAGTDRPILPYGQPNPNILPNGAANSDTPWTLTVEPLETQTTVGERTKFVITFRNNQPQPDQNIEIGVNLPEGVRLVGLSDGNGTPKQPSFNDQSRTFTIEPILEMRPGEVDRLLLELQYDLSGTATLDVFLRSAGLPQGTRQRANIGIRPKLSLIPPTR